ncbi:MAG TPA: phosphatidate cytidylyltransferase [Pseudolabrys sp.]|jgi:phosphatidate cytidylyltransferase|nr:phosphatidate cytidylyltransferase [Pseudolabrys sp.]
MLLSRVLSALVLAPIAVAAVYYGAWPFLLFWIVAATVVLWEWNRLVGGLARPGWAFLGLVYAGLLLIAPVLLRHDQSYGMAAIFILFAIVWTTDIAGYFAGRAIGGPKLAPLVSPKKTWSGAIAGLIGSMIVVAAGAQYIGGTRIVPLVALAVVLSISSQAGDLAESALKRRFDVKDASQIIPGHGGVMDRLDGFWAAVICAAVIGVVRGGFSEPAKGLLIW